MTQGSMTKPMVVEVTKTKSVRLSYRIESHADMQLFQKNNSVGCCLVRENGPSDRASTCC